MEFIDTTHASLNPSEQLALGVPEVVILANVSLEGLYCPLRQWQHWDNQLEELQAHPPGWLSRFLCAMGNAPHPYNGDVQLLKERKEAVAQLAGQIMVYELETAMGIPRFPAQNDPGL